MKIESYVLLFVGFFFGLVGLVYWLWSHEDAGSVMLLGTFLLGSVPGFYYLCGRGGCAHGLRTIPTRRSRTGRALSELSRSSIWPFVLRSRRDFCRLGVRVRAWTLGWASSLPSRLVGVVYESRRGGLV